MSQAAGAPGFWISDGAPGPAREHLRKAVAALTRARRLQVLVDHGFGGLLVGLGLATIVVLLARLMSSPYPSSQLAGAAVIIALAVAFVVGWRRRPDTLEVAIRADLILKLKQRMSTAWELATLHGDSELTDRLAVQALKAGLPADPWRVFPLRVNRWGWLAPLAATALLLVSVADLNRVRAPVFQTLDKQVVSEGQRLGAFAREMQARAERDKLPRSTRQGAQLERLGARMESGALSRSEALGRLRELGASLDQERMQALAEAKRPGGGAPRAERAQGSQIAPGVNPGALLERMRRGELGGDDTRALARQLDDLERAGIPRQALKNALESHRTGADDALRGILEKLAQFERALKEEQELSNAREQVRRALDNLGEARARARAERGQKADMDWDGDEGGERDFRSGAKAGADARLGSTTAETALRDASQGGSGVATERQESRVSADSGPSGRVLAPQGQVREGEAYTSQGQILPRLGRPRVENVEMKAEFAAQLEQVLAREQYPAHYKEFIRRYFLSLSQGARALPENPSAREERRE